MLNVAIFTPSSRSGKGERRGGSAGGLHAAFRGTVRPFGLL